MSNQLYGPEFILKERSSVDRSWSYALAEIIDTSVGAEANNIDIYLDNTVNELVLKNNLNLNIKKVALYNILGQSIKTWNNLGAKLEYRMETKIPAGIYIVRVTLEEGQIVKKIRVD